MKILLTFFILGIIVTAYNVQCVDAENLTAINVSGCSTIITWQLHSLNLNWLTSYKKDS
jgi:hypothetical protein